MLESMVKRTSEVTANLDYLKLNTGAKEALSKLSKRHKLGIVTNDNRPSMIRKLRMFDIYDFFSVLVSGDDVKNPKPSGEPILKAMETLGISKDEVLYIGDNEIDRLAGNDAGVMTVVKKELYRDNVFFRKEIYEILKT